jgi:signal transduction histidine kinase
VLYGILLGILIGVLLTASGAWALLRRHLRRVRLAEQRARAAEHMAEIGAMTGGLAHEIKNPLSTIGLNAQLLIESIEELPLADEDRSRLANRMKSLRREVERLRGILADFLEFAGKIHPELKPTDLNTLIGELVDFYLPEAERHGVRIHADMAAREAIASIDPKLIKQALLNLVLNATQAMSTKNPPPAGGGGRGAATLAPGSNGDLILRTEHGKDADGRRVVRVHVIDTGPGIPEDVLAKMFQPYFTTHAGGSGLGLPTARRLVEEHGGRIEVRSEPGTGSDFSVVLPAEEE